MKIRTGFVSNSSSSSFVCDVCGHNVSGMDMGMKEADMYQCGAFGHIYCESHTKAIDSFTVEDKRAWLAGTSQGESWETASQEEVEKTFDKNAWDFRYGTHASHCPICALSNITDAQLLEYLLKSRNITRENLKEEIHSRYKTYAEMRNDLK